MFMSTFHRKANQAVLMAYEARKEIHLAIDTTFRDVYSARLVERISGRAPYPEELVIELEDDTFERYGPLYETVHRSHMLGLGVLSARHTLIASRVKDQIDRAAAFEKIAAGAVARMAAAPNDITVLSASKVRQAWTAFGELHADLLRQAASRQRRSLGFPDLAPVPPAPLIAEESPIDYCNKYYANLKIEVPV
jgi:hypothetical protein